MIEARKLEQEFMSEINRICMSISGDRKCKAIISEDVAEELVRNSEVKLLIESIRNGTTEGKWPEQLSEYKRVRESIYEKDGLVLHKKRIIVPIAMRKKILEILHGAHRGCSRMLSRVS